VVLCWARTRFIADPWSVSSSYWNDIEDIDNNENNNNNDHELVERAIPLFIKSKKSFRSGTDSGNEERWKKYLSDGHSLQGLWAMPGRR
jgi:hypothetical protein